MEVDKFVNILQNEGIALTSNWLCRVTPPPALNSVTAAMVNAGGTRNGGFRFSVNLPGFDMSIIKSVGGQSALSASLDLGNVDIGINLGAPTSGYTITNSGEFLNRLNMFVEVCGIPDRDMSNYEFSEYGEIRSFANKHVHSPMPINYFCSPDLKERTFFEEWQNLMFNPVSKQHGYYNDYIGELEIVKYDYGWRNQVGMWKFYEVYPSRVGRIHLGSVGTEVVRLPIVYNYRNYKRIF